MSDTSPRWAPRLLFANAIAGAVLAAALFVAGSDPISVAIACATLAVVPLGVRALPSTGPTWDRLRAAIAVLFLPAGACVVVSLLTPVGRDAGLFASAWMVAALACAAAGIARLHARGLRDGSALVSSAALLYLPVGAGWLVAWRMGARPLGFDSLIVALTAVHFHYSAFAAPVLATRAVAALAGRPRRVAVAAGLAIAAAQPIVAVGITGSPPLALAGAILLASALAALSILTIFVVQRAVRPSIARVLLVVSALAPLVSMPLALAWSYGEISGVRPLGLEEMIRWHGTLNAYVFGLGGLLAWALTPPADCGSDRGV